ncbi:MAG: hypothetical protein EXS13_03095 [Planctomycetes bacterium]|nr:hypothetical protein [Planctomycetota bacterium]
MNPRRTALLLVAVALVSLVGFARWPEPSPSVRGSNLLIHSTIGGASAFLWVVDPETRNLAVYEAMPGENGGLRLLGARKIEHDLELKKYRDLSVYSAEELARLKGVIDTRAIDTGATAPSGGKSPESNAADKRDGS